MKFIVDFWTVILINVRIKFIYEFDVCVLKNESNWIL